MELSPAMQFSSEAEAIKMANNTPMGLASYFYSRDLGQCFRVSEALEYGMVRGVHISCRCVADVMSISAGWSERGTHVK